MKKAMEEAIKEAKQQEKQPVDKRTPAQIAYDKKQEKRVKQRGFRIISQYILSV